MTPRRLLTLAQGLPQGSLLWGHEGWTRETEFQALTIEFLDAVKRQIGVLANKKAAKKKPIEIPRPAYLKKKSGTNIKSGSGFAAFVRGLGGSK